MTAHKSICFNIHIIHLKNFNSIYRYYCTSTRIVFMLAYIFTSLIHSAVVVVLIKFIEYYRYHKTI